MDDYQLLVTYNDFYGVWKKKIQPSLIREGPLSINLELPIQSEITQNCNYFSPQFVESETGDSLCQLFIIAYDSKFDTNQTTEINIWRSKNPGKAFLVLILSIAKNQWSFTTQRSKIESLFNQAVPTSRVVIAKYLLDKEESISDSDLKIIHSSLANLIQISNQDQIRTLQQKINDIESKSQNISSDLYTEISYEYIKVSSELASLYHTFGFLSQSKDIYNKIIDIVMKLSNLKLIKFWPPSPKNYDIRRLTSKIPFVYGFDIIILSIHGITKSLLQLNRTSDLFDEITRCFYIVLQNSLTAEQLIFTRYWIQYTSVNFCDMIESGSKIASNEPVVQSFSMISLTQILKLLEYSYRIRKEGQKNDGEPPKYSEIMDFDELGDEKVSFKGVSAESEFLENVKVNNLALADDDGKGPLFLSEWRRSSQSLDGLPNHQTFVLSAIFSHYMNKRDFSEALKTIKGTILDPEQIQVHHCRANRVECHAIEVIFGHPDMRTPALAELLISSAGAKASSKISAVEYLAKGEIEVEVSPTFSISPLLHAPDLFEVHEIYDQFHFKLNVTLPKWLCELPDVAMKARKDASNGKEEEDNDDDWFVPNLSIHLLSSEMPDGFGMMVSPNIDGLDEQMCIEESIACNYSGKFDQMAVIIKFGFCYLVWRISIPNALIVHERSLPPSFDLTIPCLIKKGCLQSAIFTAENIDASSMEVTFTFEMDGLEEIIYLKPINSGQQLSMSSSSNALKVEKSDASGPNSPAIKGKRKKLQEFIQSEPEHLSLGNYEEVHFKPNTPIILYKFESTVKMILVYRMKNDDAVGVIFTFLKRDGIAQTLTQQFSLPESKLFNIRLFKQTAKMQQFQIVNIFPQTFTFMFNGIKHVMLPHALYSILRVASDAPLELVFMEEGWEKYPVPIVTSNFMLNRLTVRLSVQQIHNTRRTLVETEAENRTTEAIKCLKNTDNESKDSENADKPSENENESKENESENEENENENESENENKENENESKKENESENENENKENENENESKENESENESENKENENENESKENENENENESENKENQIAMPIPHQPDHSDAPWIVGEPRFVFVDPPAFPMMEDEKNWVVAPQDSTGRVHLFVPKHPGKLSFPKFQVRQQVAEPIPKDVQIMFNLYPPIVPL